jgi:ATP-dependent protease HslVU (ClpYQ) peptidase subunit
MKKISDETGQFMDSISAIELLEQYIEMEKNETNRNAANELLATWKKNKEEEKIKILNSMISLPD